MKPEKEKNLIQNLKFYIGIQTNPQSDILQKIYETENGGSSYSVEYKICYDNTWKKTNYFLMPNVGNIQHQNQHLISYICKF